MPDHCNTDPNSKSSKLEKFNRKVLILKIVLKTASAIYALYKFIEKHRSDFLG